MVERYKPTPTAREINPFGAQHGGVSLNVLFLLNSELIDLSL